MSELARKNSSRIAKKEAPAKSTKLKTVVIEEKETPSFYLCQTCGTKYKSQKNNFSVSHSELYAGWGYHIPCCKKCIDRLYTHYVTAYEGDEERAIRRICEMFDLYYCDELVALSFDWRPHSHSRMLYYISKSNLKQYIEKTYDTTLDEEYAKTILSKEQYEEKKRAGETNVSKVAIDRWGVGVFGDGEYEMLEEHYKMLKKNNPNADNNQEIFIKSLCHLNMLMMKALKANDLDGYAKANEQYSKTFKNAGLKTIQETDSSAEETFGVTLSTIAQYTPEEYYKNKKLYKDFDGLGEYISRFITRPLRNLQHGTKDRDYEFCVKDEDDDD